MNDYTGKICPYCKTAFTPSDDIVVCSQCDMPHHKDCWVENQGCTTFGCLGTIKAADHGASSVTATRMNYDDSQNAAGSSVVFCTHCGTQNVGTFSFCTRCGSRLVTVPQNVPQPPVYTYAPPTNSSPYSYAKESQTNYESTTDIDKDVRDLIGVKEEYYAPRFRTMKTEGKAASWNWIAFLFTPYWMMYRKMYGFAAAFLAADILISLIGSLFLSTLALGGYIIFGILGNSIYMKSLEGKANQAKFMDEPYKSQFIATNGGVNTAATVLTIIGRVVLACIILS